MTKETPPSEQDNGTQAENAIDQRGQMVRGPQTNVAGDVEGAVLSGEFDGPVATGDGDAVDMRESPGAIYRPEGPVEQHVGDRYDIHGVSGDVNLQRTNIRFGNVTGGQINIDRGEGEGKRCPVCGHLLRRRAKFCSRCGAELHP